MGTVAGQRHQSKAVPSNLPVHLTTFVGREPELRSLKSLVRSARIVTLTGTGGAGKSRLAVGVAGATRAAWPDRVWWVALAGESEARARLVVPDFKVAQPNREPVSAICERLDRLPLAIEMAAARLDLMSERELLVNLNDRFRVLASGARTVPERQQTMAAAIDWSH